MGLWMIDHMPTRLPSNNKNMGWSVGYDNRWHRDIGYGVPSICDHPDCAKEINRGLSYVCANSEPYGGEDGGGLYFCEGHRGDICKHEGLETKPDTKEWNEHKLNDPSWAEWRK